jgi:hypothetical protein
MAASITVSGSTFQFITLRGEAEPLGMILEDVTRPGENGHAYWEMGKRGRVFEMEGKADYTTLSAAATSFDSLKSKQGKLATVVDDRGKSWSNVMLLDVEKAGLRPLISAAGGLQSGAGRALLVVRLRLQVTR